MEAHELRAAVERAHRGGDVAKERGYAVALSYFMSGEKDIAERMVLRLEEDTK